MATPPTLIGFAQVAGTTASVVTASLSWQTGDVIVVLAANEGAASGNTFSAPTTSGSGLTFTQQQIHASASNCAGAGWTAVASASSSGTFTIGDNAGAGPSKTGGVFVWRGSAGVGNTVQSAAASRTVNLTPVGADGAICWVVGDWAAATVVTASPTPTTHSSASPGPTALPVGATVATKYTYYFDDLDDQTSAGAVGYGLTGAGTGPFTIIVIEVKAAAGGAAAAIPDIIMAPMGG